MKTEGLQNAGYDFSSVPQMDPEEVARIGLDALGSRDLIVPGAANAFAAFMIKYIVPRSASVRLFGNYIGKLIGAL
jgi:hypothetical protein